MDEIALLGNPHHDTRTCSIMKSTHCGIFCDKPNYFCASILYEADDGHCYCPMYNMHKNGTICFFTHLFVTGIILPIGTVIFIAVMLDLISICCKTKPTKLLGIRDCFRRECCPSYVEPNVEPIDTEIAVYGQSADDLPTYNKIDAYSIVTEKSFTEKTDTGLPGYDELDKVFF